MSEATTENSAEKENETFVETALKLGGKSDEEVKKTGALDRADEQVEDLFAPKYQTSGSPVHRAIWDDEFPTDVFTAKITEPSAKAKEVMKKSLDLVRRRKAEGTIKDENNKISQETLDELSAAGYWGLLVDQEFGGVAVSFTAFSQFLTEMSSLDATVSGLASVHGCIGAVDPLRSFGNPEQKAKYLPLLGSGEKLSAFALTEPWAGSDLTALRTEAVLEGDNYVVNGEKLFITNVVPGRTVGLVCLIEGKPAVLIADLPEQENDEFQIVPYGLYALKHTYNQGMKFNNFKVPKENLLQPARGDGLTIAYHGLNRGRVALCAGASGNMRGMLKDMIPWAQHRLTYGAPIETRELVRRRLGRVAGLITACDALTDWCAWLLDEGYRGEMECIVAKIFASEAQKEAAIEYYMKTHGGRAFLHGHNFGDNIHEFLAPCIYEGEGEILGLGFFKSLIKEHGKKFYEPIGRALYAAKISKPNPMNPAHAAKILPAAMPWVKWRGGQTFGGAKRPNLPSLPGQLAAHAGFAADALQKSRFEIDSLMRKHQLGLADRQCAMSDLSSRIQAMVVMFVTALWAGGKDGLVRQAAEVACDELKRKITGAQATGKEHRRVVELGEEIAKGGFSTLDGVDPNEILMNYENK